MKRSLLTRQAGLLLAATMAVGALGQMTWTRQTPFPTDRSAKSVFTVSAQRAHFVGENGLILETNDSGSIWGIRQLMDWGSDPYYCVYFVTPSIGIITGNNTALRSTNSGATWTPVSFFAGSWYHLDFVDQNVGFAGANGACAFTSDGGQTWSIRSGYPDCPVMYGMDFRDANVGLVGGGIAGSGSTGIFKTSDGGRTWTKKADGPANDVVWMSSTRAIADYGMTIRQSLDSGETWSTVFSGLTSGVVNMARAGSGNIVLGVSGKGDVWRSQDGGVTWFQTFDGPGALPDMWEISFADELHGWIVGPGGFFYYSNDSGFTWQQKNSGCTEQIWDIHMLDPTYGIAMAHNGYALRTTNGGSFWDTQKLEVTGQIFGRDEDLVAVDVVDRDFAVAAGPGGTVFKTENGGQSWSSIGYPILADSLWIYDVDFIDHNLGYVYGVNAPIDQEFLFRTRNGGASWEWVNMGNIGGGTTVQFVDADYGWLTADNDFGWRTINGGVTWTSFRMPTYFTSPEVSKVRFLDRYTGWVAGWDGYVGKTSDGGETWSLVSIGTTTDHLFDVIPVSTNEIWLCGREDFSFLGVIYRTINGGQTWTRQVVTAYPYHPYRLAVFPNGDAWFGGYAGSIFHRQGTTALVPPSAFQIQFGIYGSGGVGDLGQSDDQYLVLSPQFAVSRQNDPITVDVETVAPVANPSEFEFDLESRATTSVQLKVELWNYAQARWDLLHNSGATLSDSKISVRPSVPLSRYIESGTRSMKARLRWRPMPSSPRSWQVLIDHALWRVTP